MALTIRKFEMPREKYNIKCPYTMTPEYVVIHNTANDAPAENEIRYMQQNDAYTSFHYAVDDKEAVQGVDISRNAWHAGDGSNGPGNRKGIAIEICYSRSGGARFEKAEKNAAELTAKLLIDFGWDITKVTKHQDYSGKYCLPIDETELLTPDGWINLGDIDEGDLVAQFENGRIEFVPVQHVVEPYYADVVKARRIEATLNHDMVYKLQKSSDWKKDKWEAILAKNGVYIPMGGKYKGSGLPISDDYLKFLVWVQADGHYAKRVNKYTGVTRMIGIEFHLFKERKVKRLTSILDEIGQKYTFRKRSDGTYCIRIHDCKAPERVEQYLYNKQFSWKFLEMTDEQREVFLTELLYADGCEAAHSYCSSNQQNYDVVMAVSALHNQRCLQTTTGTSTALIFTSSRFSISKDTDKSVRNTLVSCVTVPSGAILIRQYGQPKVVGNCPHRTLDMGWQRFLDMVESKRKELLGIKTNAKTGRVTLNGYTIEECKNFSILYWDKGKKKGTAGSYINGGFFACYKEGNLNFTLPVGNLVCDVTQESSLKYAVEKYWKPYISAGKFRYGTKNNAAAQFRGKAVTTFVIGQDGRPFMAEMSSPPAGCRYAISGIPVIRDGVDVSYSGFVRPQGWDASPFYATSRNFVGLKGSNIYIVSGASKTDNFVATSEVYDKLKTFGFEQLMATDGGGSYYHKYKGRADLVWTDRDVNNIIVY